MGAWASATAIPETHIGQLTQCAAAQRALPLGDRPAHRGMTRGRLRDDVPRAGAITDAGDARQQAARGTYDPAYLNYTMGKLMIRKLREDWTATRGGRTGVARVPRSLPDLRRPADSDGQTADDGRGCGGAPLVSGCWLVVGGSTASRIARQPSITVEGDFVISRWLSTVHTANDRRRRSWRAMSVLPERPEDGVDVWIELAELERRLVLGGVALSAPPSDGRPVLAITTSTGRADRVRRPSAPRRRP